MNTPRVSILINCYNSETYLHEAVDSAFAQTYSDFEIILWDNASTDRTAEIVKSYSDPRLKYFRGEKNVPLYAARNLALKKTSGELIGFLDSDDIWLPQKLERQIPLFNNPKVGIVYSDTTLFNSGGDFARYFQNRTFYRGSCFRELLTDYFLPMPTVLVRRSALDQLTPVFDDRFNIIGDADAFRRVSMKWDVDYVTEVLTRYRIHPQSLSWEKADRLAIEIGEMLADYRKILPDFEKNYAHEIRKLEFDAAFAHAKTKLRAGEKIEARNTLRGFLDFKKAKVLFAVTFLPGAVIDRLFAAYLKRIGLSKV